MSGEQYLKMIRDECEVMRVMVVQMLQGTGDYGVPLTDAQKTAYLEAMKHGFDNVEDSLNRLVLELA